MRWLPALVLAAALGLYQLGDPSLWADEALTAEAVNEWSYGDLRDELQWWHLTLTKVWATLFGDSEVALRLPSVLGFLAAVVLLHGLTRRLFDERVASVASVLLALNPFVVKWSQQARGYSILLALAIAATWLLVRALDRDDAVAWAEYGLVCVVLVYWQPFSAVLLLAAHVAVGFRSRCAWFSWLGVAALTAPWLLTLTGRASDLPTNWIPSPTFEGVGRVLVFDLPGSLGYGFVLAVTGAFLASGRHRALLCAWAVVPPSVALLASLNDPVFVDRYLIVCCPPFAILGGVAIVELAVRARAVAVTVAVTCSLLGLGLWYGYDGGDNWAGENWRQATAYVMREAGGARPYPEWAHYAFRYYGGRRADNGWVIARSSAVTARHDGIAFGNSLVVLRPLRTAARKTIPAAP